MPIILHLATILTFALSIKTLEGSTKVMIKRRKRRQKDGI